MAHARATKRLGPMALLAVVTALAMSLLGSGAATAASGSKTSMSPVVAHNSAGKMTAPIKGTTDDGRKVKGTFTPSDFAVVGDTLMATGTLKGKIVGKGTPKSFSKKLSTAVLGVNGTPVTGDAPAARSLAAAPTAAALGSCDILNLDLGPLDLDILGLQVHLDRVVLDIVAQSGAGNLLGNLLCAVAGLLDGGPLAGLLTQLQALLTQILGQLGL
jgi:hypothetical protein